MVSLALMTPAITNDAPVPTYGELIGLARHHAREAGHAGSGPFARPEDAADAVADYERYLAVIGRHLRLITAPGLTPGLSQAQSMPVLQQLIERMSHLRLSPSAGSHWGRASDTLATAHDLLATHLGPFGKRSTPDIEVLADRSLRDATARMVLSLLDEPLAVRDDLLRAVTTAQRGTPVVPSARAVAAHLRQSTAAIARLSAQYVAATSDDRDIAPIADLTAAAPTQAAASGARRTFDDSLHALRVLCLLSFRQTNGREQASPGCLHDLIRLARSATMEPDRWLPAARTPIERVQRANATDQLERASEAWDSAATALGQHIRGLTRAPRAYAEAVNLVQAHHARHDVRRAVLVALPRLGRDAALTTARLARTGSLTVATKPVGRFQETWRLLTTAESDLLSVRFTRAGQASRTASIAASELDRAASSENRSQAASAESRLERGRDRTRRSL